MITMVATSLLLCLATMYYQNSNPMKMCVTLMATMTLLMIMIYEQMESTWFPLILYMMFTGGILMMLMILSSMMPNEKTKKNKSTVILALTMMIFTMISVNSTISVNMFPQMKMFMSEQSTMYVAVMILSMYFMSFISILTENKISMRSLT